MSLEDAKPVERTNRADALYARLRHAIVQGELRPNQRLVEAELAKTLNVSRTPIREVLQRLALDGLVTSRRRGWVVREHTADEIRDIYACRAALEGYAARLAAVSATDEQLAAMAAILHGPVEDGSDAERMVRRNERFHEAIIDAAGNPLLADLCRRSRLYFFNQWIASLYTEADAARSGAQHEQLLGALTARDPDLAETVIREHIDTALEVILSRPQLLARPELGAADALA